MMPHHDEQQNNDPAEDDNDGTLLLDLLQSCSNITTASLSYPSFVAAVRNDTRTARTLSLGASSSDDEALRRELQLSQWLRGQVDEWTAALVVRNHQLLASKKDTRADNKRCRNHQDEERPRIIQELREQLFDATLQKDRENILLKRIQMSTACMFTTFPQYASFQSSTNSQTYYSNKDHGYPLRKQALHARDYMVLATLDTLAQRQSVIPDDYDALYQVQQQNCALWNKLLQLRKEEEESLIPPITSTEGILEKEIALLENIILHTICGSGIDWYKNRRLREAIERLRQNKKL